MRPDELQLPAHGIDKAFAVDVNVFWAGDPERELEVLRSALRPGGTLHLLYGTAAPTAADRILSPVARALSVAGFAAVEPVHRAAVVGIAARAPGPSV